MSLSRQEILEAKDITIETVDVPEWGGAVNVRTMTGTDRDMLEASIIKGPGEKDLRDVRAKMVVASVVDDLGKPLFTLEDVVALGEKSAAALDRIFSVAQRLSGFSKKDVEDLAKN